MLKIKHNPHITTAVKAEEIDLILDQYRRITSRINDLFMILTEKVGASWQSDGIGTCGDGPHQFDDGLTGDLTYYLPELWSEVADSVREQKELGGYFGHLACPYHAKDEGCVLGDIKPARCAGYVEQPDSLVQIILGESAGELGGFLRGVLTRVMNGTENPEYPDFLVGAQANELFVEEALNRLNARIDRAKAYVP